MTSTYYSDFDVNFDHFLTIFFPSDVPTGIEDVKANTAKSGQLYNLMGEPVSKDYKSIVIEDGKKVIVR